MTRVDQRTLDRAIENPLRRRWWIPLSLRLFLAALVLLSAGSVVWVGIPAYWEQQAIHQIRSWGGPVVETETMAPIWLRQLVGNERMRKLRIFERVDEVNLSRTRVTDGQFAQLSGLKSLTWLDLSHGWSRAETRDLAGLVLTDARLAHISGLTKLERLILDGTAITNDGLVHLADLTNLRELDLAGTNVSDAGLVHLRKLKALRILGIGCTAVTDAGLVNISELQNLSELSLNGATITDAGLTQLSRLSKLTDLNLMGTEVPDTGLVQLHGMKKLRSLSVKDTLVTESGIRSFRKEVPGCQCSRD